MKTRILTLLFLTLFCYRAEMGAQEIIEAEYFFDNNDPGYGNATALSGFVPDAVAEINDSIATSSLSPGWHYLNVRTRNDSTWGTTTRRMFYLNEMSSNVKTGSRIERAEYFFGSFGPGMGQGQEFALLDTLQEVHIQNMLPVINLSAGINQVSLRLKQENGGWSATSTYFFYLTDTTNKEKIKALSYEIRQNGSTLTTGSFLLSPSQNLVNVTFDAATGPLGAGMYEFCLKAVDESNTSSQRSCRTFQVTGSGGGGGGVSIEEDITSGIIVYPNPTQGPLTIESESLPILSYQLSDAQGRLLLREEPLPGTRAVSLSLAQFPRGTYFLATEVAGEVRVKMVELVEVR